MPTTHRPILGNFCWVEANVADLERAKGFYGHLFGWQTEAVKYPPGDYTLLKKGSDQVGGMFALPDEEKKAGAPPNWLNYVAVPDIALATKKAETLGARVYKAPFDAGPGRMSIIADPAGAGLALWQSTNPTGTYVWQETNTMCWQELTTTDAASATKFYVEMFGWNAQSVPMGELDYTLLYNAGQMVAGLMPQPKATVDAKARSFWTVYFEVADCDATADKAKQLGGSIVTPPTDIPNIGRFAVLRDLDGAGFAVITNHPRP